MNLWIPSLKTLCTLVLSIWANSSSFSQLIAWISKKVRMPIHLLEDSSNSYPPLIPINSSWISDSIHVKCNLECKVQITSLLLVEMVTPFFSVYYYFVWERFLHCLSPFRLSIPLLHLTAMIRTMRTTYWLILQSGELIWIAIKSNVFVINSFVVCIFMTGSNLAWTSKRRLSIGNTLWISQSYLILKTKT